MIYTGRGAACLPVQQANLKKAKICSFTSFHDVYKLEATVVHPIALMQQWRFKFDTEGVEAMRQTLKAQAAEVKLKFVEILDQKLRA